MSARDTTTPRVVAGRYEFEEIIGRGGMGLVWRARDRVLERTVAVNEVMVPPGLDDDERTSAQARVLREARAAARLGHPGVVTVFDVLQEDGQTYIVMELMQGQSLEDLVAREGPLPPEEAARIGVGVAQVLEAAHAKGIVHRDVKPGNVMVLGNREVKLADFGIASIADDPRLTTTGIVIGSPAYMAPEQARGSATGPYTDLWGLGATLYFAVEGIPPFQRGEALATLVAVASDDPAPMERAGPLRDVVLDLLNKDPRDRPSGATLLRRLEAVAGAASRPVPSDGEAEAPTAPAAVPATPAPWPTRTFEPEPFRLPDEREVDEGGRRPWAVIAAVGGTAALLAVLVAFVLARAGDEPDSPPGARPSTPGPTGTSSPSPSPTATATSSPTPSPTEAGGAVPEGFVAYTDPDVGYSLAYPEGWDVVERGNGTVDFQDPESGAYLRVQYTGADGTSPQEKWEDYSEDFADRHRDYQEIGITPTTFLGYEASMWEFTYAQGQAKLHAADLGFETGDLDFALLFQTAADDWEDTRELHQALLDSFSV